MSSVTAPVDGHVAVCGGGLIGTSLAMALLERGNVVRVHDQDPGVREDLRDVLGAGSGGRVTVAERWSDAVEDAAVVIAAVPPPVVASVLAAAARLARPTALLTDVAGIKREVVAEVARELSALPGAAARFVGGHPMAGSERSGPRAGDAALFSAATWVLTPTDITSDAALARASDLARGLGARVLVLAPDEHDTIVGLVSHLPQLIASVLADVAAEAVGAERDAVMAVAGPGFRDTTRIAASDPGLWLDIVEGNHAAIVPALDAFAERFVEVQEAVRTHDRERLGTILRRASESRRRLVPKGSDEPTTDLVVPLRDRPGEISRIAGALGSAGINIEDLSMRHASAADRGSLLLRVREDAAERAVAVLAAADVSGVTVEVEGHPSIGPGSGA